MQHLLLMEIHFEWHFVGFVGVWLAALLSLTRFPCTSDGGSEVKNSCRAIMVDLP